jgi:hypothetical protein
VAATVGAEAVMAVEVVQDMEGIDSRHGETAHVSDSLDVFITGTVETSRREQ